MSFFFVSRGVERWVGLANLVETCLVMHPKQVVKRHKGYRLAGAESLCAAVHSNKLLLDLPSKGARTWRVERNCAQA